jgi:DNA-binding MarR family transcriptional regulator
MTAVTKPAARAHEKQRLRLWIRLLRAMRAVESELRERLRVRFSMTLPQFDVMAALYREEHGMTMTELSRRLMVSNGNVTGIIDRLVAEAYVLRHAPAEDRRTFIVRLTPKGAARFATVAEAHEHWVDELLAEFNSEEMEMLIGHFDGLAERIRKGGTKP